MHTYACVKRFSARGRCLTASHLGPPPRSIKSQVCFARITQHQQLPHQLPCTGEAVAFGLAHVLQEALYEPMPVQSPQGVWVGEYLPDVNGACSSMEHLCMLQRPQRLICYAKLCKGLKLLLSSTPSASLVQVWSGVGEEVWPAEGMGEGQGLRKDGVRVAHFLDACLSSSQESHVNTCLHSFLGDRHA